MNQTIYIPLILSSFLFLACGSGDSSSNDSFSISTTSGTFKVIEGMKKDIQISSNRDNIIFKILDKSEAPKTLVYENSGILVYRAPANASDEIEQIKVVGIDKNGKQSEPLTITFKTVSDDIKPTVKILKTGANDGGLGEERIFVENADGDIVNPLGFVWAKESTEAKSYFSASLKCEMLKVKNEGSNWRLPTRNEAFNLIDYSKVTRSNMLDDAFTNRDLVYMWVQPVDDINMILSLNSAQTLKVTLLDQQQNYTSRCINAPEPSNDYIVSTDRLLTNYTYDLKTGLQWSPIKNENRSQKRIVDDINETASEYCTNYKNENGWRLPSINELRSIVEKNSISNFIVDKTTILVSSTPFVDVNTSAKKAHHVLYLIEDGTIGFGVQYVDELFNITCVKKSE